MASYCKQPTAYGARPSAATVVAQHQQRPRCGNLPAHKLRLNTLGPSALNKPLPPPVQQNRHAAPYVPQIQSHVVPTTVTPTPAPTPVVIVSSPALVATTPTVVTVPPLPPQEVNCKRTEVANDEEIVTSSSHSASDYRKEIAAIVKAEVSACMQILQDRVSLAEQRLSMLASRIEHTSELIVGTEIASKNARTAMSNEWQESLSTSHSLLHQQLETRVDELNEQIQSLAATVNNANDLAHHDSCADEVTEVEDGTHTELPTAVPTDSATEHETSSRPTPHVHVDDGHILIFHSGETPFEQGIPAPNSVCQRLVRSVEGESSFQTCIMMNNGVWAVIQSLPVTKFIASISSSASAIATTATTPAKTESD